MATLTNLISNATGNVGIGTTSTDAKLQVYSTTGTTQIFNQLQLTNMGVGNNGDIVGIGFAAGESTQYGVKGSIGFVRTTSYGRGDITFYTNNTAANESVSTSNERMRITSGGNVLIGVNGAYNSSRLLQVKDGLLIGNSFYTFASIDTSGTADLILSSNANPANLGSNSNIIFKLGTSAGGGPDEKMRIVSDGNVGIGTSSPSATLNVRYDNAGASTVALFENRRSVAGSPDDGQIVVGSRGYNNTILRQNSDQGTNAIGSTLDTVLANTYSLSGYGKLILATQSTARLTIDTAGNVGIGTTSPTSKLHIVGDSIFNGQISSTGAMAIGMTPAPFWNARFTDYSDGSGVYIGSVQAGGYKYISGESYYNNSSFWQSNKTTSTAIGLGDGILRFYTDSGLTANTNFIPSERMRITVAGNVGIGTTSPIRLLQVNGDSLIYANVSGAVNSNKLIFGSFANSSAAAIYAQTTTATSGDLILAATVSSTITEFVRIQSTGNVGIGTTSPASILHISGSGQTIMRLDSSTTTNISQFMVKANTDGVLIMGMSGGSAASTNYGVTAAGQAYIGTTTLSTVHPTSLVIGTASPIAIIFSTNLTQKARITANGSLLVGTTVEAANTAGTTVATNFKGINAYEFNDTTGRGSTQGISWNYSINTTHIIDITPGDSIIACIDVRLAAYSSAGSGYANSLFCYGGHVGAYNITTVFNVINGNVTVSAAIVSSKLRITITIANTGQSGECVLTVTDANKNGTLSTIVRS